MLLTLKQLSLSVVTSVAALACLAGAVRAEGGAQVPPMGAAHHGAMAGHEEALRAGEITVSAGFTRATLPGAPVAGGFLTLRNEGSGADRLLGASADFAAEVQVHEMAMEGDVMKMRPLAEGLPLPPQQTVVLQPGGYHLMFLGLSKPLTQGETVQVTLRFEHAGTLRVPLQVLAPGAKSATHPAAH